MLWRDMCRACKYRDKCKKLEDKCKLLKEIEEEKEDNNTMLR